MDQPRLLDVGERPSRPPRPGGPAAGPPGQSESRVPKNISAGGSPARSPSAGGDLGPAEVVGRAGPPLGVRLHLADEQPRVALGDLVGLRGADRQVDPGRDQQQVGRAAARRGRAGSAPRRGPGRRRPSRRRWSRPPTTSAAARRGRRSGRARRARCAPASTGSPASPPGRPAPRPAARRTAPGRGRSAPRTRRRAGRRRCGPGPAPLGDRVRREAGRQLLADHGVPPAEQRDRARSGSARSRVVCHLSSRARSAFGESRSRDLRSRRHRPGEQLVATTGHGRRLSQRALSQLPGRSVSRGQDALNRHTNRHRKRQTDAQHQHLPDPQGRGHRSLRRDHEAVRQDDARRRVPRQRLRLLPPQAGAQGDHVASRARSTNGTGSTRTSSPTRSSPAPASSAARWCLDFGYFKAHNDGLDLAKVREVPRWRESDVFTPLERDVLEYAEAMSRHAARPSPTRWWPTWSSELGDAGRRRADPDDRAGEHALALQLRRRAAEPGLLRRLRAAARGARSLALMSTAVT